MLLSSFFLILLYLTFNYGAQLFSERDVYHTLFGNIASMEDLFLKVPNATAPESMPGTVSAADDNDTLDELDLELPDIFEFHKANLTNQTFDILDYMIINEKYSNFTKEYKSNKNKMKNGTRRVSFIDPDDLWYKESIEFEKKEQMKLVLVQFVLHCRYQVGNALLQRQPVRNDKRYQIGYLFNRMRRLKTEQLKMVGAAWAQNLTRYTNFYTLMRMYERVVHFDVDMRDTAAQIKRLYAIESSYDLTIGGGKNKNRKKVKEAG